MKLNRKRKYFTHVILALIFAFLYLSNAKASNPLKLIAEHATLYLVSDTFKFTEGPASDTIGNVYFTDIPVQTLYKYNTDSSLEIVDKNIPGGNGLAFDNYEKLVICGHNQSRCVYTINLEDNSTSNITCQIEGKKFNSPNDLWIDAENGIYFTDPRYGNRDNMELPYEQVYYIKPDRTTVVKVTNELVKPNGIYGTNKGKTLLIADPGQRTVFQYKIKKDGKLTGKKAFIQNESVDGMTMDILGNIYIASNDIKIFNPKGYLIEVIKTPGAATNICFGGSDLKTLFITERQCVYTIKMNVKGNRY